MYIRHAGAEIFVVFKFSSLRMIFLPQGFLFIKMDLKIPSYVMTWLGHVLHITEMHYQNVSHTPVTSVFFSSFDVYTKTFRPVDQPFPPYILI